MKPGSRQPPQTLAIRADAVPAQDIHQENIRYPRFELALPCRTPYSALHWIDDLEHTMEYLGFLSLGVAIASVGLRCYFSLTEKATLPSKTEPRLSSRARRVQEATLARRLLRYHRGLSHA